jgi:hypothetical protein
MKRRSQVLFLVSQWLLCAQSVRMMPDLAVAEAEYHDAEESWLRNDPTLSRDLYSTNRSEMVRRIHHAAALRDDVMKKKEAYLGFLVKRIDDMGKRLSNAPVQKLPLADLRRDLEGEQSRILGEQGRLEDRIHDIPEGDEYTLVRRAMELERTELVSLQNSVALRIHAIDNAAKAQQAASGLSDVEPLMKNLDAIRDIWEGERARAVAARPVWARYYTDLEKSLTEKDGSGPAPSTRPGRTPSAPMAPAPKDKPRASNPAVLAEATLSGVWVYRSHPGAWIGWGEPEMVLLQLRQAGPHVVGTYTARLPGRNDKRLLNLSVEGPLEAKEQAYLRWTSFEPPAHGAMSVKLSRDGRLLVERVNSDDSYIPQGMEVLQR